MKPAILATRLISRLKRIDWDFAGSRSESLFSTLHWHPARFASQLPASLIGLLSRPGQTILDPFMGSGTTLVEAQRLGRRAIGIDVNPVSYLISEAKTLQLSAPTIAKVVSELTKDANQVLDKEASWAATLPVGLQATKWYTETVIASLGSLWDLIGAFRGPRKTIAQAAFSACLMPSCREDRHWGYICDNSTPKGNKSVDVIELYTTFLERLASAYSDRDKCIREAGFDTIAPVEVICEDARQALKKLGGNSVDLVVTSPPYFGVSDYVKAQRLSMEWFDFDIEPLRRIEIGARSKRHRKTARKEYLTDLRSVFEETYRCLRPNSACVIVVGESRTRDLILSALRDSLEDTGFNLEVDINRRVSSQRRQTPSITGEHVFVLSK